MKLLLDQAGMVRVVFRWETSDHCRHYVAEAPARATAVFDSGLDPTKLTGAVVEAECGLEMGFTGYVRSRNVDLPHTQIVIHGLAVGPPDTQLSRMLAAGLQDND